MFGRLKARARQHAAKLAVAGVVGTGLMAGLGAGGVNVFIGSDTIPGGGTPAACDLNATTANFASQVSAATAGQTICLASGTYGTFAGTNKAITIKNATGATPTMDFSFDTGDTGFTLDGMSGMGGDSINGASNITIKNSTFASSVCVTSSPGVITFDNDTFTDIGQGCGEGRMTVKNGGTVSISNSVFNNTAGGNGACSDGIQLAGPDPSQYGTATVLNTEFYGMHQTGCDAVAHVDAIQLYGGNLVLRDSYFHNNSDALMSPDSAGTLDATNNAFIDVGEYAWWGCLGGMTGANIQHNYSTAGWQLGLSCTNGGVSSGNTIRNNVTLINGGGTNTTSNNVDPTGLSVAGGTGRCAYKTPTAGTGSDGTLIGLNDCP